MSDLDTLSDLENEAMPSAPPPAMRAAQRWNIVWVVPLLALLIGAWMIYRNVSSKGPVATVRFDTADGVDSGKTEVRCRSVRVGFVKDVKLSEDLKSVFIRLELDPEAGNLFRRGARFWVVRPRLSASAVTGVGTFLTGAYVELDPGPLDAEAQDYFVGLETPPATDRSVPGRRLVLHAAEAGSLAAGSPIYYRGYEVGRIESRVLEIEKYRVTYGAFIREEYSFLVKENSRFWNTSGIDISASAEGFKLRTPSLQAMLSGGASFDVPEGIPEGKPASDGTAFTLFINEDAAKGSAFNPSLRLVLLFDQSVRGLTKQAPVEFRGIQVGRVTDISGDYLPKADDATIPVVLEIDPSLMRRDAADQSGPSDLEFLAEAVRRGLRASLKTGNFLTGSLYVDLDYVKNAEPGEMGKVGELASIPTVPAGLEKLENTLANILAKIEALPMDETMQKLGAAADDASAALKEIQLASASARKTLESPEFASLPADLGTALASLRTTLFSVEKSVASVGPDGTIQGDMLRTLDELRASLRSLKSLTNEIDEKPNSLLFGRDSSPNMIPKAPKRR